MASENVSIVKLRRPCRICGKYFTPTGKACKLCEECKEERRQFGYKKTKLTLEKRKQKEKQDQLSKKLLPTSNKLITKERKEKYKVEYFANKEKLDLLRDNITLDRWKILSRNYKLGKKIWGNYFTRIILAKDMDMAYTTVQRCLALDRANERSWKLVNEGKISVFKLAMICSLKNNLYQDKVVDMVINSNLSTCKIKKLHIDSIDDVNKERHRIAVEEGYSRKDSAYYNFNNWIERGKVFMLMDIDQLPSGKLKEIKNNLEKLRKNIDIYLKKFK